MTPLAKFEKICHRLFGKGEIKLKKHMYWVVWAYVLPTGEYVPFGVDYVARGSAGFLNGNVFRISPHTVWGFYRVGTGAARAVWSAKEVSAVERETEEVYKIIFDGRKYRLRLI